MNTRSTTRSGPAASTTTSRDNIFRSGDRRIATRNNGLARRRDNTSDSTAQTTFREGDLVMVRASALLIGTRREVKYRKLLNTERRLVRSCEHVILLNDKIRGLTSRYRSAREEGFKSFRYNLRIRLAAVEGVRNMYYEYARDRAEEVAELRKDLYDQNVEIVTASDQEDDSDIEMEIEDSDDEEDGDSDDDEVGEDA